MVIDKKHRPYAIGYRLADDDSKLFYISDYGTSLKTSSKKMMSAFLDDFLNDAKGYYIYCHNLDSFDGYFLLKDLNRRCEDINILMDANRRFISIDIVQSKTRFRDSLRILPASLDSLSKMFNVDIKKGHLDHNKVNKSLLMSDEFKHEALEYLDRDLISLLDVLNHANEYLLKEYQIDFTKCYSASSMAMKIYRTKFMDINKQIPILAPHVDKLYNLHIEVVLQKFIHVMGIIYIITILIHYILM